ncbi:MAG: carbohydrate binding family 9 domain-containing protein [Armatimonadetes bacterium]|nr:carbohydrate binding family 9 domain-containing protein [Armatimonadota bacterium]
MKRNFLFLIFILLFCFLYAKEEIIVPRLAAPPAIDGVISEGEWDKAIIIDKFYQTSPGDNTEPSEKTEFFVGYDDKYLYFLAKCYAKDTGIIRDFHCSRDAIYTTDRIFIFLDTFYSNQQAYYVGANPNGEQADGIVINDIDPSIDLFYESSSNITDYGYLVEIALPFKSIKYKSGRNVSWGFFLKRHIPHKNEEITCFPVKRGGGNYYDNYGIIKFENIPAKMNLKLIPAVIGNYTENEDKLLNETGTETNFEPEMNIFFEPNSNLTMKATINPDFNIIEADALNIDVNNRFPLFYTEKRPFFIEQTNPFYTDINIFYTRQIVAPEWGAKLSGTFGKYSVLGLAALDEKAPAERFFDEEDFEGKSEDTPFVFTSVARKLDGGDSRIRLAGALRKFNEYENFVLNLDTNFRITNEINFEGQLAASSNEELDENTNGYGYATELNFYNGTWFLHNFAKGLTKDFTADLGFISETDINYFKNRIEYQLHSKTDEDKIRYMEIASTQAVKYDYALSDVMETYWEVMLGGIFKSTFEFWTGCEMMKIDYAGKDNHVYYPWLCVEYYPLKFLGGEIVLVGGENLWYGDEAEIGDYRKFETTLFVRPTNNLDIEFRQKYHETVSFYIARTYEAKVKFQFHKNFWIRAILQYSNNDIFVYDNKSKDIALYPLFTYKPNANTAIYLGATRNEFKSKPLSQRELLEDTQDTMYFLKISYSFDMM